MTILITGGCGYLGSHTCVELLNAGYKVVVLDNLSNSSEEALNRVMEITEKPITFYKADLLDKEALRNLFIKESPHAVIHFAGLKAVGESVSIPLRYYSNNLTGTLHLCQAMSEFNVRKLVFSSSATVYGNPEHVPVREDAPLHPTNPYGRTKLMIEDLLRDLHASDPTWHIALLRYFNPVGAHASGRIGEEPRGVPSNLVPYLSRVALGKLPQLQVFGGDYPTPDGTGIRDYVHVTDLAVGHIKALEKLESLQGIEAYNLGTGRGLSVLDMIRAFEQASGRRITYNVTGRRSGDIAVSYANAEKALKELNWKAERTLAQMCESAWKWQINNPNGFKNEAL